MILLTLAAIVWSALLIGGLCIGDPKRLRATGQRQPGHGSAARRAIACVALLPGLGLALNGDSAAFLMWLGACAILGFIVALLAAGRNDAARVR